MSDSFQANQTARKPRFSAFLPLGVWLAFSAVLLSWDYHRKNAPRTTISFDVSIEGKPIDADVDARLGNRSVFSGSIVPVGWRTLLINLPDAEPFRKKVFVWYGGNNLGTIPLQWSRGTLDLKVGPVASEVRLNGPRHVLRLENSCGTNVLLPIGTYEVIAEFEYFSERTNVTVVRMLTNHLEIKPAVGSLTVSSQPPEAEYRIENFSVRNVQGSIPATITALPPGEYRLIASRGDYQKIRDVTVESGKTNAIEVVFEYGAARIETEPAGARIVRNATNIAETPFTVVELAPGDHEFRLEKDGFVPVPIKCLITGTNTVLIQTNLISIRYVSAMENARQHVSSGNFEFALKSVDEAITERPGDSEATALKSKIEQDLHAAALREEEERKLREAAALEARAADERARAEQAKRLEQEKRKADEQKRRQFAAATFAEAVKANEGEEWFDTHAITVTSDFGKVCEALLRTLDKSAPRWKVAQTNRPDERTFVIQCSPSNALSIGRHCTVVACEIVPGEVQVYAKFWMYVNENGYTPSVFNLLNSKSLVPAHRKFVQPQAQAGIEMVRKEIPENFMSALKQELR